MSLFEASFGLCVSVSSFTVKERMAVAVRA
jgi:hypothetical protein